MLKTMVEQSSTIVNGFNSCMDCSCEKFKDGYITNICVCGHHYTSHHFYQTFSPLESTYRAKIEAIASIPKKLF